MMNFKEDEIYIYLPSNHQVISEMLNDPDVGDYLRNLVKEDMRSTFLTSVDFSDKELEKFAPRKNIPGIPSRTPWKPDVK